MVCKIEEGLPGYGERGTLAAESQKLETDRKQSMELNGEGHSRGPRLGCGTKTGI